MAVVVRGQEVRLSAEPLQDIPLPATAGQAEDFAWRMFVALNWPAMRNQRGLPDESRHIGDAGPTVWQTFKTSGQLFTPDGHDPGPWGFGGKDQPLKLEQVAKATERELELSEIKQAIGGPLTDQHGNVTYYEKAGNVISYDFIRQHKLYTKEGQRLYGPVVFPFGAIEVKAAWRILTQTDDPGRYYTAQATVRTSGTDKNANVGLVGFHIIVKTPNAPQWIWTTFEQVDNVPGASGKAPWSYYDATSKAAPNKETPPGTPAQVTRYYKNIPDSVNAAWRSALKGTRWQYYQLIGVQYPSKAPRPDMLANVVMETYIQPQSSCIACHSTATTLDRAPADFSFMLLDAVR
jgi:hypothetical protein